MGIKENVCKVVIYKLKYYSTNFDENFKICSQRYKKC